MSCWSVAAADARVNTTTSSDQETSSLNRGSQQAVSLDAVGNLVIVWTSKGQDHSSSEGVFARRLAPDGSALTGEILVNSTTTGDQNQASVASDDSGNFVVTWTSDGQDGSGTGVYLRRFAANGTALTGEIAVNTTTNGAQQNSVIALNRAGGGFVVAWQGQGAGDSDGIFFRRFASDGTALDGAERLANSVDAGPEQNPSIAISATGNFVIAYDVIEGGISPDLAPDIYFQRFNSSGVAQGALTKVDEFLVEAYYPTVAMDANGNFVCFYRVDSLIGFVNGVWGRSYASNGSGRIATFQVMSGSAAVPSVAMASTGEYVIAYETGSSGAIDTFVRRYGSNSTALAAAEMVNQYTTGSQNLASVAVRHIENYAVVWSGKSSDDSKGVAVRVYASEVPIADGNTVSSGEDDPYVFSWADFSIHDVDSPIGPTTAVRLGPLPSAGELQYFNGSAWVNVALGQVFTKTNIDAGRLRFLPGAGESGYPGYATAGVGNQRQHYSQFSYTPLHARAETITNANGELDIISEGNRISSTNGWTNITVGFDAGVQNLPSAASTFLVDHDNCLYVTNGATLVQTLGATFSPHRDYNLAFEFGWRGDVGSYLDEPGFEVQLWAGGTLMGTFNQDYLNGVQGEFVSGVLAMVGNTSGATEGSNLQIRLVGTRTEANFDNLSLVTFDRATEIGVAAQMTIDIVPTNDAPTIVVAAAYNAVEQVSLDLKNAGILISDLDAGISNVTVTLSVAEGMLTVDAGSSRVSVSGSGGGDVTLLGPVAEINDLLNTNATSRIVYLADTDTPSPSTAFTLTVNDNGNTGLGGEMVVVTNSVININAVNDSPEADGQSVTTPDGVARAIGLVGRDVEGDAIVFSIVTIPTHGNISGFDANSGTFVYTPTNGYAGPDSIAFRVFDGLSNSSVAVVSITVTAVAPQITVSPVSQIVSNGSSVTLSVTATGTFPLTYRWLRNGVALAGETGPALTFTNVQVADSGTYRVVVSNEQGSATSSGASLAVVVEPLLMTDNFTAEITSTNSSGVGQSSNTLATVETDEPLHAEKIGGKSMWFSWQAPATGIATFSTAGSDFDTLLAVYQGDSVDALTPVTSDDDGAGFYNSVVQFHTVSNGVYRIAVDGAGGASGNILLHWSFEETIDVLPVITNQPTDRVVSLTSNAVFTVGVSGAGVAYQWFFNDVAVPEGTNSTWTQAGVGLGDVGQFKVQATIGTRTVTSRSASLGITLSPTLDQDFSAADKFSDTISSGRRLRLDPPPAAGFSRLPPDVAATSRGYSGSQVFSTVGSLKEPGEPDHCGVPGGASRWFAFEAETDGVLDLNTDGSTFDTILAVYTGTNANFSELTSVACDNDSGTNGVTSSLHFTTVTGTIYYIAVDGVNGASGTVLLNYSTLGEQQRPSITVTSAPPVNVGLTNHTVTISGLATDNTDLIAVQWRMTNSLGSTVWTNTTGTNAWTLVASNLVFGRNSIQIRSLDSWGNFSATNSLNYLRLAPVTVTVEGCGSVSSGFLGTTYREPGRSVVITATPCANSLFAGWSGDQTTNGKTISVLIQTGLVMQASFMTNPFALRPGTYTGLVYDTNVVSHERAGFVTIRTTPKGTYSGKVRLGGRNLSFSGVFGLDGLGTNTIRRGGLEAPLGLELNFNSGSLVQGLAGRLRDTNWMSELVAYRTVFHSRTNPAPQTGRYTLIFPTGGAPGTPEGDGFASITVASGGVAKLKGSLADNTAITHSAPISREGLWPFHVSLRGGRGAIWSWLAFETNAVTIGTNLVQGDLAGDVRWVAKPVLTAKYYPAGFTNAIEAVGARYRPPTNSLFGALTFSNGVVVFSGGNLTHSFTNRIQHATTDKVLNEETNALSLSIARPTGLFSGSVVVPESGAKVSFKGALFQSGDVGFGYSLQTNATGPVLLAPRE